MISNLRYVLIFSFILFVSGCRKKTALPDMRETYSAADTKPFGGNIAFRLLQNSFPDNFVQTKKMSFEDVALGAPDTASLYCCIARNFFIGTEGADAILDYVYKGNTFFLSAANIDTAFLQKLYCKAAQETVRGFSISDDFGQTSVQFVEDLVDSQHVFSYYYRPFNNSFSELNETYSRIVGYNSRNEANCIVFFWGKGKMFIHADPRAFSNYFLLKDRNYLYMKNLLQLVNESPEHVYWDDYYSRSIKPKSGNSFSSLSEILKYPTLTAAFWIALLMLLFYILFGMKRRQRIIPQILPNRNSSVAFTETIARLYLQKNDNKNIAEKMISYFNEYIRSNYFLYANAGSDAFIQALSRKSGVSLENTVSLYHAIDHANKSITLDDYQLLSLNEQIQQFYKKRP